MTSLQQWRETETAYTGKELPIKIKKVADAANTKCDKFIRIAEEISVSENRKIALLELAQREADTRREGVAEVSRSMVKLEAPTGVQGDKKTKNGRADRHGQEQRTANR